MVFSLWFVIFMVVLFMFLLPSVFVMFFNHKPWLKWVVLCFFIIYLLVLFAGVFGKIDITQNTVYITFENNGLPFNAHNFLWWNFDKANVLINLFMLFPVCLIIFAFCKKHTFLKTIILAFCLSAFIETMQFILPVSRTVEITDLLYNTLSGIIGWLYFYLLIKLNKKLKPSFYSEQ